MFLKATNDKIDQFPYTVGNLRRDNPKTSFPKKVPIETMAEYGMLPVVYAADPEHDPEKSWIEVANNPVLVDGVWTILKTVVNYSKEELDDQQAQRLNNVKMQRAEAYRNEADPIFFKSQRDEALATEWEAKVDEIRLRYPYPEAEE